MKTKRITTLAIMLSISIVLSIVESTISVAIAIPIPGVKLGLANIVTLIIMYMYGERDAFTIVLLRIVLVGLLRGNIFSITFYLSFSGGMFAYIMMVIFKNLKVFSPVGVSIMGAFGHSVGQIVMAIFLLKTQELIYYFPLILVLSVITGVLTGLLAQRSLNIMKRIQ